MARPCSAFFSLLYFHTRAFLSVWFFWRTFYVSVSRNCDCIAVTAMSAVCVRAANVMVMATRTSGNGTLDLAQPSLGVKARADYIATTGKLLAQPDALGHAETKDFHGAPRDHVVRALGSCMPRRAHCASFQLSFFFFFEVRCSRSCD